MRSLPFCLIILFSVLTAPALAGEWSRTELMALLASSEGSEQRYTETRELAFLEIPVVSRGRLIFTPPDRLVKQVEKPNPRRYVIAGDTITITAPDQDELVINIDTHPLLRLFTEALRAVLAGDLESLERHYKLELTGERSQWQLQLSPLDSQVAVYVRSLTISGRDRHIERMVTQEQGGDRTTLTLLGSSG